MSIRQVEFIKQEPPYTVGHRMLLPKELADKIILEGIAIGVDLPLNPHNSDTLAAGVAGQSVINTRIINPAPPKAETKKPSNFITKHFKPKKER